MSSDEDRIKALECRVVELQGSVAGLFLMILLVAAGLLVVISAWS